MKINPKYGDKIISLPAEQVLELLPEASRTDLAVLIYVLSNRNATYEDIEDATGVSKDDAYSALTFWKQNGVISCTGLKARKTAKAESESERKKDRTQSKKASPDITVSDRKKVFAKQSLPSYSASELSQMIEGDPELKELIDASQQILGKIFKVPEIETVVGMRDYLRLEADYILLLCSHCANIKKTSLRYVETVALDLYDSGITEYSQLEKYLENRERIRSLEGQIRRMLGIGSRALTSKEERCFEKWADWGFPFEMIKEAYEITVNNTQKVSVDYMTTILDNWRVAGFVTVEEARAAGEKRKKASNGGTKSSFDTSDFFSSALERSYGTAATDGGKK